jgi:hypothetical protein
VHPPPDRYEAETATLALQQRIAAGSAELVSAHPLTTPPAAEVAMAHHSLEEDPGLQPLRGGSLHDSWQASKPHGQRSHQRCHRVRWSVRFRRLPPREVPHRVAESVEQVGEWLFEHDHVGIGHRCGVQPAGIVEGMLHTPDGKPPTRALQE